MTAPSGRSNSELGAAAIEYLKTFHAGDVALWRAILDDVGKTEMLAALTALFMTQLEGRPDVPGFLDALKGDAQYRLPQSRRPPTPTPRTTRVRITRAARKGKH